MERNKLTTALRVSAAALIGISAITVGANGIYATLNASAENITPQIAQSGTLSLTMANATGSAGFDSKVSNLAPGDVVNRYVSLTNGGSLASTGLSVKVAATGTPALITDGTTTKALRVTITSCSVAWNVTTGACSGTTNTEVAAAPLSALNAARPFTTTTGLAAGGVSNLQVSLTLPDQNETTVNGVAPANTVQGGAANLTYTFTETQAAATVTNS